MPTNMLQLLSTIEITMKLGAGLALVAVPRALSRICGLPAPNDAFWPRLLGATLIGLGLATLLDGHAAAGKGLGAYGAATINLSVAAGLGALLILGQGVPAKRGRAILWLAAACLSVLALVEIISAD